MIHTQTTPPAIEPVTLAEMRAHVGISQATETSRDAIITARIAAARMMVEGLARVSLITQTFTAYGSGFRDVIPLRGPLQSVTSVQYLDSNGNNQTLANTDYDVDTVANVLVPAYNKTWPTVRETTNSVRVVYVCGFGDAADDIPMPIREAIKFIVSQWEIFQSTIEGNIRPMTIPNAAKELIAPYADYREIYA